MGHFNERSHLFIAATEVKGKREKKSFFSQGKHRIVPHDSRVICCSLGSVCVSPGSQPIYSCKKSKAAAFTWLLSGKVEMSFLPTTQSTILDGRWRRRKKKEGMDEMEEMKLEKGDRVRQSYDCCAPCCITLCSSQQPEGSRAQIWPANQKVNIRIRLSFFFFASSPQPPKPDFTQGAFN